MQKPNSCNSGSVIGGTKIARSFDVTQASTSASFPKAKQQTRGKRKCDYCKQKQSERFSTEAQLVAACPPFARLEKSDLVCGECVAHIRKLDANWLPR